MEIELEALFERYRGRGELAALEEVFERTAPELLKVALHLAPEAAAAEDLVQATFLKALENAAKFDARRALVPWLVGILVHEAARVRRERARALDPARLGERVSEDPAASVADAELAAELARAVRSLPEPYRAVLEAHLLEGARAVDIAARLERAPGTVRMQILRGLELLKQALPPSLATAALLSTGTRGHAAVKAAVLARAAELALPLAASRPTPASPWARASHLLDGVPMLPTLALSLGAVSLAVLAANRSPASEPMPSPRALPASTQSVSQTGPKSARTVASGSAGAQASTTGANSTSAIAATVLRGRVHAADGTPVAGVPVELQRPELRTFSLLDLGPTVRTELVASATSDAEGRFEFTVERGQPYDLSAQVGAFKALSGNRHAGDEATLTLLPERRAHGHVTKPDGTPAVGARVRVRIGWEKPFQKLETSTGPDGAYELALPAGERNSLTVAHSDGSWWSFEELAFDAAGQCQLDVHLRPGAPIAGRVTDAASGAPIAGASVSEEWTNSRTVTTDADGRYTFLGCAEWSYFASAPGYGEATPVAGLRAEANGVHADFMLRPSFRATGRVLDEYGDPVADAYVAAVSYGGGLGDWISTRTDAAGEYELEDLTPPGNIPDLGHALLVAKVGQATQVYDFPHTEGSTSTLELGDVVLRTPQVVSGRVVDASGAAVVGAALTLTGWNNDRFQWTGGDGSAPRGYLYVRERRVQSGADGRFWFADVPAGLFELTGLARGRAESNGITFQVQGGEDKDDLVLTFGGTQRIFGRVVDEQGTPLAGASVCVNREGLYDGYIPSTRTDAQGNFELEGLVEGEYDLEASGLWLERGSSTPWIPIFRTGITSGPHELVLPRGETIEGQVLRPDGTPAIGLQVQPRLVFENSLGPVYAATSDLQGRFRLELPRDSVWTIDVYLGNFDGEVFSIDGVAAGSHDLVWTLPR